MLPNKQIDDSVREHIVNALIPLLDDENSLRDLAAMLLQSDIADSIPPLSLSLRPRVNYLHMPRCPVLS